MTENSNAIDQRFSRKLYKRLQLRIIFGLVATGLLVGITFSFYIYQSQTTSLIKELDFEIKLQNLAIQSELERFKALAKQITSRSRIRQELEKFTRGQIELDSLVNFSSPKLFDAMLGDSDILGISRLSLEGRLLVEVGSEIPGILWPENFHDNNVQISHLQDIEKQTVLVVSAPIVNPQGEKVGIDIVAMSGKRILDITSSFLDHWEGKGNVRLATLTSAGVIYFFSAGDAIDTSFNHLLDGEVIESLNELDESEYVIEGDVDTIIVNHKRITGSDWVFLFIGSQGLFFAPVRANMVLVGVGFFVLISIGVLLTILLVRPLAGRISIEADSLREVLRNNTELLEKVTKSEERFDLAMRASNDGLWDWDLVTNEVYFSPPWKSMLGYQDNELANEFSVWEDLIDDDGKAETMELIEACLTGKRDGFFVEFRMRHKDGHWVDILSRSALIRDDQENAIRMVGIHTDLTERKKIEDAQMEQQKAEEATKLKSEFLANMSHEIRTPMNGIIGMSHLALKTDLTEQQRNYIGKVHSAAQNLLGILNDILDFSKIESGRMQLEETGFELKSIVDNMVNLIKLKAHEKDIQISVEIEPDVPEALMGDPLRLSQILVNLGSNAVKFSGVGDTVSLKVTLQKETDDEVTLLFSIEDTGIGIAPEQRGKLFQPFSQTDSSTTRKFGGTGLGLVICRKIVHLMSGNIWFESEEGVGSNFHFTVKLRKYTGEFPVDSETALPSSVDVNPSIEQLWGKKILLVEDNEINQELVIDLVTSNGMTIESAYDGQEALDILSRDSFDIVLMDCQMPVMDGYETTREIRKQESLKGLPVIAMTANVMKGDREKALEAGMDDYIGKPIDPDVMFATMAKWMN